MTRQVSNPGVSLSPSVGQLGDNLSIHLPQGRVELAAFKRPHAQRHDTQNPDGEHATIVTGVSPAVCRPLWADRNRLVHPSAQNRIALLSLHHLLEVLVADIIKTCQLSTQRVSISILYTTWS